MTLKPSAIHADTLSMKLFTSKPQPAPAQRAPRMTLAEEMAANLAALEAVTAAQRANFRQDTPCPA